jgi:membrane protein
MGFFEQLGEKAEGIYERLNDASGGVLGVIRETIERFGDKDGSQWAASLAYYIFFALFPLLLVLVSAATYIFNLGTQDAAQEAVQVITEAIPIAEDLVAENLEEVVELRGTLTFVGIIGLLWSASNAFAVLSHSINAALETTEPRGFVKQRLVALAMTIGLVTLLLLSLLFSTLLDIVAGLELFGLELAFMGGVLGIVISRLVPLAISLIVFIVLYRWLPTRDIPWKAVLWGAGFAAVAWELAKSLFTWYIQSGLPNYGVVYGSLSSVVILLFWIYVSSNIVLLGAHLVGAIKPHDYTPDEEEREEAETDQSGT